MQSPNNIALIFTMSFIETCDAKATNRRSQGLVSLPFIKEIFENKRKWRAARFSTWGVVLPENPDLARFFRRFFRVGAISDAGYCLAKARYQK